MDNKYINIYIIIVYSKSLNFCLLKNIIIVHIFNTYICKQSPFTLGNESNSVIIIIRRQ